MVAAATGTGKCYRRNLVSRRLHVDPGMLAQQPVASIRVRVVRLTPLLAARGVCSANLQDPHREERGVHSHDVPHLGRMLLRVLLAVPWWVPARLHAPRATLSFIADAMATPHAVAVRRMQATGRHTAATTATSRRRRTCTTTAKQRPQKRNWCVLGCVRSAQLPSAASRNLVSVDAAAGVQARTAFYELRFANHGGGEALARQHLAGVGKDEDLLVSFGLTHMQTTFLKDAIAVIAAGRHAAKWTYVHAFFITDPRELALFQDMQARLEHNLEQLHGMVNSKALQAFIAKSSEGSIGTIVGDMLMRRQTIMDFAKATQQVNLGCGAPWRCSAGHDVHQSVLVSGARRCAAHWPAVHDQHLGGLRGGAAGGSC